MRKYYNFLLFLSVVAVLGSASQRDAIVKLESKPDEIASSIKLKNFIKANPNPSIVLRVPNDKIIYEDVNSNSANYSHILGSTYLNKSASSVNSKVYDNSLTNRVIYNTIEKEFVKAGFIVRDSKLFEKELENKSDKLNTDLIIEYTGSSDYTILTNKYFDKKNEEYIAENEIKINAKKAEFKIIKVKENELVGTYTFYFIPCINGCTCLVKNSKLSFKEIEGSNTNEAVYVTSENQFTFYKEVAEKIILEIRK
jgi:hypothetical protein